MLVRKTAVNTCIKQSGYSFYIYIYIYIYGTICSEIVQLFVVSWYEVQDAYGAGSE